MVGVVFGIQSLIGVFGVERDRAHARTALAICLSARAGARLAPVLLAGVATTTCSVLSLLGDVVGFPDGTRRTPSTSSGRLRWRPSRSHSSSD